MFAQFFSPPVISGSHTLQHPARSKHDMMMAAQMQQQHNQNMRQMGTHTLGRHNMPSHASPQHHGGGNNKHG